MKSPKTCSNTIDRQLGLLEKFCACDPATITEVQSRNYILHVNPISEMRDWVI